VRLASGALYETIVPVIIYGIISLGYREKSPGTTQIDHTLFPKPEKKNLGNRVAGRPYR
jgi:hypothetical protein